MSNTIPLHAGEYVALYVKVPLCSFADEFGLMQKRELDGIEWRSLPVVGFEAVEFDEEGNGCEPFWAPIVLEGAMARCISWDPELYKVIRPHEIDAELGKIRKAVANHR